MLKPKQELVNYLIKEMSGKLKVKKAENELNELVNNMAKKHGFSVNLAYDLLSLRLDLENQNNFNLFCMLEVVNPDKLSYFYSEKEIKEYEETVLESSKIKFPLKFNVIEIAPDQWITSTDVKQMMKFRDASLIRYNENMQRTLNKVVNGEVEYYRIAINKVAIRGIESSFTNNTYIPNTITLNIPETADFGYKDGVLTIRDLECFDILDGYHRYIGMSNIFNKDPEFNYTMELRLVSFPIEKARQFIWQEDQKTKMSKTDSESFNQNSAANMIVSGLNLTLRDLKGEVTQTGIINAAVMARTIDFCICKGNSMNRAQVVEWRNYFKEKIDEMTAVHPELVENKWKTSFIMSLVTYLCDSREKDVISDIALDGINGASEMVLIELPENSTVVSKRTINRISAYYSKLVESR